MPDGSFERCFADELHVKRVVVSAGHPFIIELPWGAVLFHANEITLVSTVDDPPGIRFCSIRGGLGKLSWNIGINIVDITRAVLTSLTRTVRTATDAITGSLIAGPNSPLSILDLKQTEVVLMQGKQDEQFPAKAGGEFTLHLADPLFIGSDADKAMNRVILLNSRSPEITGGGGSVSIPPPSSGALTHDIWSPDGYSVTQMNDGFVDAGGIRRPGNFVTYGLARAWDKSRYMATFSSDTGTIPNDQRKWEGAPE